MNHWVWNQWRAIGRMRRWSLSLAALAAIGLPVGTAWVQADTAPVEAGALELRRLCILTESGGIELDVEVARTVAQRSRGLMERESLPERAGMVFLYDAPQPPGRGFWMYRTLLPLDLAFLDGAGNVLETRTMVPCSSSDPRECPVYSATLAYQAALEVNAHFFDKYGIGPGARVVWGASEGACPTAGGSFLER